MVSLHVRPEELRQAGRSVCGTAAEVAAVRLRWDRATEEVDATGYREVTAAFETLREAWFDELGLYNEALRELCSAMVRAADAYAGGDRLSAEQLRPR